MSALFECSTAIQTRLIQIYFELIVLYQMYSGETLCLSKDLHLQWFCTECLEKEHYKIPLRFSHKKCVLKIFEECHCLSLI